MYLFDDGPPVGQAVISAEQETAGSMIEVKVVDVGQRPDGPLRFRYQVEATAGDSDPGHLRYRVA